MRDVILSSEVGRGRGLGFLLRQCLSGGVFRWLMLACGEDIDKVIQVRTLHFVQFFVYVVLHLQFSVASLLHVIYSISVWKYFITST